MSQSPPKGTYDITPSPLTDEVKWHSSAYWVHVEALAKKTAELFGCSYIATPIFESADLYMRSVGETSDIVSKEMYLFEDRSNRKLSLRPEGTASVVRALIHKRLFESPFKRLYYLGPMFRYERPQSGRYRQHRQFGVELFGSLSPYTDVEAIDLMLSFYASCGLKDLTLNLNSLGTPDCQKGFACKLKEYLLKHKSALGEDSLRRLDTNPLRILDTKDPKEKELLLNAPKLIESLSSEARAHFDEVEMRLNDLSIPYVISERLVRGLDYYTHTVFEVTSSSLGAQNSIGGGGRYNNLVKELGGPNVPAVGFATGLERVVQTCLAQDTLQEANRGVDLYLFALGDNAHPEALRLTSELRKVGISVLMDLSSKKPAQAITLANKLNAKHFAVLGESELKEKKLQLKHLDSRTEKSVIFSNVADVVRSQSGVQS